MTINDLHAAQIESTYFILLSLGACTFCLCVTAYICMTRVVEALNKQKVVIQVPVHDPTYWMNHHSVHQAQRSVVYGIPPQFSRQTEHGLPQGIPFVSPS